MPIKMRRRRIFRCWLVVVAGWWWLVAIKHNTLSSSGLTIGYRVVIIGLDPMIQVLKKHAHHVRDINITWIPRSSREMTETNPGNDKNKPGNDRNTPGKLRYRIVVIRPSFFVIIGLDPMMTTL